MATKLLHLISLLSLLLVFAWSPIAAGDPPKFLRTEEIASNAEAVENCTVIACKSYSYIFADVPPTEKEAEIFRGLTPEQQKIFLEKRRTLLNAVVKVVNSGRLVLGTGTLVKGKIMQLVRKGEDSPPMSFAELSRTSAHDFMSAIDLEIWGHAPVVAASKEFGFTASINVNGGAAFVNKGFYRTLGVGFSAGFDYENNKFVFELFAEHNKLVRALPIVAQVAVSGSVMGYSALANRALTQRGRYITPPGPVATFDSAELFSVGPSQGLGFPPLDTFYAYEAAQTRYGVARISVSP